MTMDIASKIEAPIAERSDALKEDTEQKETEGSVFAGVIGREEMRAPKQVVAEEPGAAYPPILDGVAALLSRAVEYNWPIFDLNAATHNNPLVVLSHHLFTTANLFEAFSIPRDKFRLFTKTIQKGYHADLPYHNSIHATDVLHCMSFLANDEKIKQVTSDIEVFSMYLAAMIHDHDHPGFNNNFLVNTFDPKAMLYNDKSVLENHHVASSFSVLMQPEYNFLSHLSKSDFKAIREIVVDLVLATANATTILQVASSETFDPYETREDRMLLYKIMMKCSDVSNPSKDMSLYEPWCRLIMDEFFLQGDMEKKLNLPVSPYMDRDNVNVPSSQIGFIDYVVMPLFDALDKFQPIPNILNRLQRNREYWAQLKAQGISHLPPLGSLLSASINAGTAQAKGAGVPRPSHTQSQVISGSKAALATAAKLPSNSPSASQQDGLGTGAEDDSEEVSPTDETA
nr:cAMP-specific 3',5'-cyclic phosphodiesterase 4D [Polyrhizophydium stewartii]